jgi:glycine/D-amino acid oxidase-like deaminating enzyme
LLKLGWIGHRDGVVIAPRLGTTETTAIVHPRAFTSAMMSTAQEHGAELRHGRVTGIVRSSDGSTVRGVEVDGGIIAVDAVVVAMGPWSLMVAEWLVLPAVFGRRSPTPGYAVAFEGSL